MNGFGVKMFPGGAKYVGRLAQGIPHGRGVMVWPDGRKYEGNFESGVMEVQGLSFLVFSTLVFKIDAGTRILRVVAHGHRGSVRICGCIFQG